jgi:uncharacterized membrane protein YagU involved in acid resistance
MTAVGVIALSGGVAGVLDLAVTGTAMRAQGMGIRRLLQFIASGALGSAAFEGGAGTAGIGLVLHFLIAAVWAAIYFVAGRTWPVMLARPFLIGALYGVAVHLVMSRVVVPLSRTAKRPFTMKAFVTQLVIHVVCVGVPIAVVQSYWGR